jgi:hypothetical protein
MEKVYVFQEVRGFRRWGRHPDYLSLDDGHDCLHLIRYNRLQLNRLYAASST